MEGPTSLPGRSAGRRGDSGSLWPDVARILVVAAVYFVAAKLSLRVALVERNVTPVWPPTGVAVVAMIAFGRGIWPGITLGAFAVNAGISPIPAALGIAAGNTLAPLVAVTLLAGVGFRPQMDRLRDAVALVFPGALFSMCVSATAGTSSLIGFGDLPARDFLETWAVWWAGDAMGVLVFAPLFLSLRYGKHARLSRPAKAEALVAFAALVVASALIFKTQLPIQYVVFPLLGWIAVRFRQQGAAPAALVVSGIAVHAAVQGAGPFEPWTLLGKMITLQVFNGGVALTSFVLAAIMTERRTAAEELRRAHTELEERVRERTVQLTDANSKLGAEIAERMRAAERLRVAGSKLAQAQHIAHLGSWEWDVLQNRVTWSDELYRIYGVEPQTFEATYEGFLDRVHPEDREMVNERVQTAFRTDAGFDFVHRIVRSDGVERILHGRGEVAGDEAGIPVRMAGTSQDITDRVRAEESVARELRALSAAKDEFIATAAHELRTPLATVKGLAQLLERRAELSSEQMHTLVETINRQTDRLTRLVAKLLDVSQIETGRVELHLTEVDLAAVVNHAIEAAPSPDTATVRVAVPAITVTADAGRLEQILVNLLTNAYRYGGTTISVSAEHEKGDVFVSVADDGAGVPNEFVPHLFEKFRRGRAGPHQEASGLGLAIVRGLVEAHGGGIRYETARPHGARFVFSIPVAE
jgi:PAS domain S-box-containing protein